MRELLAMFSSKETVDDLGIGQIRDTFSDLLFPGTSVLLTRARYLLIVPWCFMTAEGRGLSGRQYENRVERNERDFIKHMLEAGAPPGLIGRDSGPLVKRLPSVLYRNALATYRIRLAEAPALHPVPYDATDELTDRRAGMWHPTTPRPPQGFPKQLHGGLDLTGAEAAWLRDRILDTVRDSLLGDLVLWPGVIRDDTDAPWSEPATGGASSVARQQLEHARLFSGAMHGAELLYNLLLAERAQRIGLDPGDYVDFYVDRLRDWSAEVSTDPSYRRWDLNDFWSVVEGANPRVRMNGLARQFVTQWIEVVRRGEALMADAASDFDNQRLRALITDRERLVKGKQARLSNDRRLKSWNGQSGAGRLTFRWTQVRRIIRDIQVGLRAEVTDASA